MFKTYMLTEEEILDAIVKYIGTAREGIFIFPFKIKRVDNILRVTEDMKLKHLTYNSEQPPIRVLLESTTDDAEYLKVTKDRKPV